MENLVGWNVSDPVGITIDQLLYRVRVSDPDGLLFDTVELQDILFDADSVLPALDALYAPMSRLERKVEQLKLVMNNAAADITVVGHQISEPFKQNGTVQVAVIYTLSDAQTITIYFHNPDSTPDRILPNDVLISWKWLLNRKDITIVVAPEGGRDINVREIGMRIMKLASKNSPLFTKKNEKKEADKKLVDQLETDVADLESKLEDLNRKIEIAKLAKDEKDLTANKPDDSNSDEKYDGYVNEDLANMAKEFKNEGFKVEQIAAYEMSITTPLSGSVVSIECLDDGSYSINSSDEAFDGVDLGQHAVSVVRDFKKIDLYLSLPDLNEFSEVESGIFENKTLDFVTAIHTIQDAVNMVPGLSVVFSDFNATAKNGDLFDSSMLAYDSINENSKFVYGITAQVGIDAKNAVLGRFDVNSDGDIVLYKGSKGDDFAGRFGAVEKANIVFILKQLMSKNNGEVQKTLDERVPELKEYISTLSKMQAGKVIKLLEKKFFVDDKMLTVAEGVLAFVKNHGAIVDTDGKGKILRGNNGHSISAKKVGVTAINFGAWLIDKGFGGDATEQHKDEQAVDSLRLAYHNRLDSFVVAKMTVQPLLSDDAQDQQVKLKRMIANNPEYAGLSAAQVAKREIESVLQKAGGMDEVNQMLASMSENKRNTIETIFNDRNEDLVSKINQYKGDLMSLMNVAEGMIEKEKGNNQDLQPVQDLRSGSVQIVGRDDPAVAVVIDPPTPKDDDNGDIRFLNDLLAKPDEFVDPDTLQKIQGLKLTYENTEHSELVSLAIKALQKATFKKLTSMVASESEAA